MSGLVRFFRPFLNNSSDVDSTSDGPAPAESKSCWSSNEIPYEKSYFDIGNSHDVTTQEEEEEEEVRKTFREWKHLHRRLVVKYIARRTFQKRENGDDRNDCRFDTREDVYYACKFGLFPVGTLPENNSCDGEGTFDSELERDGLHPNTVDSQMLETQAFQLQQDHDTHTVPGSYRHRTDSHVHHPNHSLKKVVIPCIKDLDHSIHSISEINLTASNLTLRLASVVNLWKLRVCKPSNPFRWTGVHKDQTKSSTIPFPREWLDNGPLFSNYRTVLSMEIRECDVTAGDLGHLRNLSEAVFGQKTRRILIFFYDSYANAISNLLLKAERSVKDKSCSRTAKSCLKDLIMISLKNIPSRCIFPYFVQDYWDRVHGKPLESEYGFRSDYCICIGGDSNIKANSDGETLLNVRFDSEHLEIGLVTKRGMSMSTLDEYKMNRVLVEKFEKDNVLKVFSREENSNMVDLCKTYLKNLKEAQKISKEQNDENILRQSPPDMDVRQEELSIVAPGGHNKRKSSVCNDTFIPLSEIGDFYLTNSDKRRKDREVDICAAVLNVGVPRQTKRNWMMNLVIFDESLQYPLSGSTNDMTIPQVRLVIFSNRAEDFPQINHAGDILIAQRLLVDKFEGELQLTAWPWSKFAVCRPTMNALELYHAHEGSTEPSHPTNSENDWDVDKKHIKGINLETVNNLWRFAQKRMDQYPNVQPRYQITLADLDELYREHKEGDKNIQNCGDLTAMICSVVPYPLSEQSLSSPKGLLRIWDGTGMPCCDPLPEGYPVTPEWSTQAEPDEDGMVSISKIIERIKKGKLELVSPEFSNSQELFDSLEAPKCLCGRISNVVIWEAQHWSLIQRLKNTGTNNIQLGTFVRFRNAVIKAEKVPSLHVNINTTMTPIPVSTYEVKTLFLRHFLRTLKHETFNPRCALLPLQLSERLRGGYSAVDTNSLARSGFSRLVDCILAPPFTPIKVMFQILGIKQGLKTESLRDICIANGKKVKYQCVFHVCDSELDLFLIVPDLVAQKIFGTSAYNIIARDGDQTFSEMAEHTFSQLLSGNHIVQGTVVTIFLNERKFFVLTDCSKMCMEHDGSDLTAETHH